MTKILDKKDVVMYAMVIRHNIPASKASAMIHRHQAILNLDKPSEDTVKEIFSLENIPYEKTA